MFFFSFWYLSGVTRIEQCKNKLPKYDKCACFSSLSFSISTITFRWKNTLFSFHFVFTIRSHASIDMESRIKNASQVGPCISVAFQFSTSLFILHNAYIVSFLFLQIAHQCRYGHRHRFTRTTNTMINVAMYNEAAQLPLHPLRSPPPPLDPSSQLAGRQ